MRRWWCNFVTCILQTLSDDYKAPVWTENPWMLHILAQEMKMSTLQNWTTGMSSGPLIKIDCQDSTRTCRPSWGWAQSWLRRKPQPSCFSTAFCLWEPILRFLWAICYFQVPLPAKGSPNSLVLLKLFPFTCNLLQCAFCTITQYFASHPRSCKDQEEYWCWERCHKTIIK